MKRVIGFKKIQMIHYEAFKIIELFIEYLDKKQSFSHILKQLELKGLTLEDIYKLVISEIHDNNRKRDGFGDFNKLYQYYYYPKIIILLIDQDINTEVKNDEGFTALYIAAASGQNELLNHLLDRNANINSENGEGNYTALFVAAEQGHICTVKLLIDRGAIIDYKTDSNQWPPLYISTVREYTDIVRLLLENGAKADSINEKDIWTALYAASSDGNADIVQLLLKHGKDPNVKNWEDECTALYVAARKGRTTVAKLLLDYGANINYTNGGINWLPLHIAAYNGYSDIVKLLLERGGIVDLKSGEEKLSPLYIAAEQGYSFIVKLLLDHGANPNLKNGMYNDWTALYAAAENGHAYTVTLLLDYGAKLDERNKEEQLTALDIAKINNHTKVIDLLVNYKKAKSNYINEQIDEHFLRIINRVKEVCIQFIQKKVRLDNVISALSGNYPALDNRYLDIALELEEYLGRFRGIGFDHELWYGLEIAEPPDQAEQDYKEAINDVKALIEFIDKVIIEHTEGRGYFMDRTNEN